LADIAVSRMKLGWLPSKGYHFPDGAYVEYGGAIPEGNKNLAEELTKVCQSIIEEAGKEDSVVSRVYEYEEAKKEIKVPEYLPEGKPVRYLRLSKEDEGCFCGGTHVRNVKEIGRMEVTKIQKKGKNVRVSYKLY